MKNVTLLIIISALFVSSAFADRAHRRIREGVKSGELTKEEARALRKEQREIRRERRAARKGGLTREERAKLREDKKDASKNIYEEKHDSEKQHEIDTN